MAAMVFLCSLGHIFFNIFYAAVFQLPKDARPTLGLKPSENRPMQKALKQNNLLKFSRLSSEIYLKTEREGEDLDPALC